MSFEKEGRRQNNSCAGRRKNLHSPGSKCEYTKCIIHDITILCLQRCIYSVELFFFFYIFHNVFSTGKLFTYMYVWLKNTERRAIFTTNRTKINRYYYIRTNGLFFVSLSHSLSLSVTGLTFFVQRTYTNQTYPARPPPPHDSSTHTYPNAPPPVSRE